MSISEALRHVKRALNAAVCGDMCIEYDQSVTLLFERYVPFRVKALRRDNSNPECSQWQHGRWFLMPINHSDEYMANLMVEAFTAFEEHEIREKLECPAIVIRNIYPPH